jgi:hypothetical protein
MGWCNYLLNKVIDLVFSNTAFVPPATLYLGLAQSVTNGGLITGEPTAVQNYARVALTQNVLNFPLAGTAINGSKTAPNTGNFTFNQANVAWGNVNVFFFSDVATIGNNTNTWAWGQLTVNKNIGIGDTPYFSSNDITLNIV